MTETAEVVVIGGGAMGASVGWHLREETYRRALAILVNAQQARRILDRIVGHEISPLLWRKVAKGLSAGRVQSVALRLITDREREIEAFVAQEYWSVTARLEHDGTRFEARLVRFNGEKLDRLSIGDGTTAEAARAAVEAGRFTVADVETKPFRRNPAPPFTTSTLQQEAARKLGFSASHTMRCAQNLYEAGAITYMRTDGVQMDGSAIAACRRAITDRFDGHYLPEKPRMYQAKAKNAQEAHEAIRPTDFGRERAGSGDEARLYDLIYKRAMASQMAAAAMAITAAYRCTSPFWVRRVTEPSSMPTTEPRPRAPITMREQPAPAAQSAIAAAGSPTRTRASASTMQRPWAMLLRAAWKRRLLSESAASCALRPVTSDRMATAPPPRAGLRCTGTVKASATPAARRWVVAQKTGNA